MTTMVATWDPSVDPVGEGRHGEEVRVGSGHAGSSAMTGRDATTGPGASPVVGDPPVAGGWEALVEHARALGPDPAHAGMDDAGLEMEVRRAAGAQAAATARLLALVGEFVARDLWVDLGMVSPGQWLSWAIGMAPSTAREMVRVALALRTFTATAERFARGEVSYSKVRAITRCGEPVLEALLLQYADNAPASQLERIVRSFRNLEDDVDPHDDRMVAVRHGDRHVTLTVRLPVEVGLEAVALMDRLVQRLDDECQPTDGELPAAHEVPVDAAARLDPMSARRADAVVHGLRLAVDHLDSDLSAAARTTLVLVGDLDSTIDQLAVSHGGDHDPDATTVVHGRDRRASTIPGSDCSQGASAEAPAGDPQQSFIGVRLAGSPACSPSGSVTGAPDVTGSVDGPPRSRARPPGDSVTLRTESGSPVRLSRRAVRALACDSQLRRVVTAGETPVDVGRTHRLVTWRLRAALRARDGTCRFPGCAATRHLHAHHVTHWADGGPTDMANLVLLCGAHHRFVHSREWVVESSDGAGWTFRAPDAAHPLPSALQLEPPPVPASAEAARGHDPWALQPAGWDGDRLDLDAALNIMWQELGRLPGGHRHDRMAPRVLPVTR
ncbi:MAG TPA: DUF222 domain-containing protein [Nitriliruptoraceae bacterium]|nr:DUF222 domain-containing protein [Nitriliruptoraceae bacterium]